MKVAAEGLCLGLPYRGDSNPVTPTVNQRSRSAVRVVATVQQQDRTGLYVFIRKREFF